MARRRFVATSRISSSQRRKTQWGGLAAQSFIAVSSAGATLISSTSFEAPATVVRCRGNISLQPDSFASDANVTGAIGMGVVSAEALGVGVSAVPEPFTDADWGGWMVWHPFSFRVEFVGNTNVVFPATISIPIDSKAMRKVEPNEALVFVAESFSGAYSISEQIRILVMLH